MKVVLVTDANPMLSALLGGAARHVFFDSRFEFATTQFTIEEVQKYLPKVVKKSGVSLQNVQRAFELLPVTIYSPKEYRVHLKTARLQMQHIDPKDVDILALYLQFQTYLWTHDKDFVQVEPPVRIVHTSDLLPPNYLSVQFA